MRDAHIVCICPTYKINDLGEFLVRGQKLVLPEDLVLKSSDLRRAENIKAVEIQWVERCRVLKQPSNAPPYLRGLKKAIPQAPEITQIHYVPVEAVKELIQEELANFQTSLLTEIKQMLARIQVQANDPRRSTPDVPVDPVDYQEDFSVFIPSDLIGRDAKTALSTKSTSSEGGSIDKALGALRSVKNK